MVIPSSGHAQETQQSDSSSSNSSSNDSVKPLVKGEQAPFDGYLLTPDKAISIGQKAENCDLRLNIETTRLVQTSSVVLKAEKNEHKIDIRVRDREIDYWKTRATEAENQPFYSKPWFISGLSVVLTLTAVIVSIESLKAATK